jgi:hypothetical protein
MFEHPYDLILYQIIRIRTAWLLRIRARKSAVLSNLKINLFQAHFLLDGIVRVNYNSHGV